MAAAWSAPAATKRERPARLRPQGRRRAPSACSVCACAAAVWLAACASWDSLAFAGLPAANRFMAPAAARRPSLLSRAGEAAAATATDTDVAAAGAEAAIAAIADKWEAEARRCWGPGPDGHAPGLIPEMTVSGREYNPQQKVYVEAPALTKMAQKAVAADRPWKRASEDEVKEVLLPSLKTDEDKFIYYYSGKEARDTSDVTQKDYAMAIRYFVPLKGDRMGTVLDLGCGDGLMARRLLSSGSFDRVFALDCVRKELVAARASCEAENRNPEDGLFLARADAQNLPFKEGQLDAVWWGLGMHVVHDLAEALRSIFFALRPGTGKLLATTRVEQLTAKEIRRVAEEVGFEDVVVKVPRSTVFALQARRPA